MPTTTRLALPYPTVDDEPAGATQIQALAEKVDAVVAIPDAGDLKFSARTGEHGNWIKADGRALTAGQYTNLRNALIADGSPFGATSGNPKLPDMRGRAPVGAGTATGAAGATAHAHGQQAGEEKHVLTTAEMPAHTHSPTGTDHYVNFNKPPTFVAGGTQGIASGTDTSTSAGGGGSHENMPPYTVGTWFIYAG